MQFQFHNTCVYPETRPLIAKKTAKEFQISLIFQKSQVVVTLVYPGPPEKPRARDLYVAGLPTLETVVLPGD